MANFDFKTATPDATFPSGGFLFGADSQSAATPSIYAGTTYLAYILGLANTWTAAQRINVAGSAASPSLAFSDANTGFYQSAGGILDMTIEGAQSYRFSNNGLFFVTSTGTIALSSQGRFGWEPGTAGNAPPDVTLYRDSAANLALRDGTNAQTFRTYGTYTDSSNYRRVAISMTTAGVASITPEGDGTGSSGNVLHISGLPTSNPGPGILWNNAGTPAIGT